MDDMLEQIAAKNKQRKDRNNDSEREERSLGSKDSIQRAVIESAKANIRHRDEHEPNVSILNFPDIATPENIDALSEQVARLIDVTEAKEVDFSDLIAGLDVLGIKMEQITEGFPELPAFPEIPQPLSEIKVTNLDDLEKSITDAVNTATKTAEQATRDIKVEAPAVNVVVDTEPVAKEVSKLTTLIEEVKAAIPPPTPWDEMKWWFQQMNDNLEWIASRPQAVGAGGGVSTGGTTTTPETPTDPGDTLLLETGDDILLETGDFLLIE